MKTQNKLLIVLLGLVMTVVMAQAQNNTTKIDADGKITDGHGKHIGTLKKDGTLEDVEGKKICYLDTDGMCIDAKSGMKMGKPDRNGNFTPMKMKSDSGLSVSAADHGMCVIKDKDGHVKAEVHENFKQYGACAIHCLNHSQKHDKMKNMDHKKMEHHDSKQEMAAEYVCPMHPDVTSDKPGKCSKCGMDLEKVSK